MEEGMATFQQWALNKASLVHSSLLGSLPGRQTNMIYESPARWPWSSWLYWYHLRSTQFKLALHCCLLSLPKVCIPKLLLRRLKAPPMIFQESCQFLILRLESVTQDQRVQPLRIGQRHLSTHFPLFSWQLLALLDTEHLSPDPQGWNCWSICW